MLLMRFLPFILSCSIVVPLTITSCSPAKVDTTWKFDNATIYAGNDGNLYKIKIDDYPRIFFIEANEDKHGGNTSLTNAYSSNSNYVIISPSDINNGYFSLEALSSSGSSVGKTSTISMD
jgi:hypothetical protein